MAEGPSTGSSPGETPQVSPGPAAGANVTSGARSDVGCPGRDRSLKRPSGWIRRRSRSFRNWRRADAGTSALMACSHRLRTRTRAPAAATRSLTSSSDAQGRAKSHTENVVSCTRVNARDKAGETTGWWAANQEGGKRGQTNVATVGE